MRRVGNSDLGGFQLVIPTRVPRPGPSDTHSALPSSATAGPADPAEDQGVSQQSRPAPASRLVTVRESLLSSGDSDRVSRLISQSRRESTQNVDNYRWARWQDWCNEHSVACVNSRWRSLPNHCVLLGKWRGGGDAETSSEIICGSPKTLSVKR